MPSTSVAGWSRAKGIKDSGKIHAFMQAVRSSKLARCDGWQSAAVSNYHCVKQAGVALGTAAN
jgi:hypothetical protein